MLTQRIQGGCDSNDARWR